MTPRPHKAGSVAWSGQSTGVEGGLVAAPDVTGEVREPDPAHAPAGPGRAEVPGEATLELTAVCR